MRTFTLSTLLFLVATALQAQPKLEAVVEAKRFQSPKGDPIVVVNISFIGATAEWTMDERSFRHAQVEVLTLVEQDGTIVDYRKTMVSSPERSDTLDGDFMHQERFTLKPGSYALSVELHDANSADTSHTYISKPLVVTASVNEVALSDIQFTRKADSNGDVLPFPGSFFPDGSDRLGFYAEAYGTVKHFGPEGPFLATAQIEGYEDHKVVANMRQLQRLKADTVVPIGMAFGIGKLPSGNYVLALELRDRNDSVVVRREQFFQRMNPMAYNPLELAPGELGPNFTDAYTNADTLAEYLSSMRPIANDMEAKIIDDRWKDRKIDLMRDFFYTFWYNRSPQDPEGAWKSYQQAVVYANKQFGCRNMRGYQSDQGRIFLKYGAPNAVVDRSNETAVTPYMVWHYYRAGKYNDRRFVFTQEERSTTCWTLLTSDMPGELNNSRWLDMIAPGNVDGGVKRDEVLNNYKYPK
ncbi:MAG: GWxTD domain-containing protein [Flavobacteriales bacterium]|nr:GWxTD domain-containing protein [Flavobacteriales bacterium]